MKTEFGGGGGGELVPYRPPARDAGEPEVEGVDYDENGGGGGGGGGGGVLCQIGSEVMVLKSGEHMNRTGTVVGTHNGYYQVEMDGGRGWLNCRLKELCNLADRQRLVAPPRSRKDGPRFGDAPVAVAGVKRERPSGLARPPPRPADEVAMELQSKGLAVAPKKRSGGGQSRRVSDLVPGNTVMVRRDGPDHGATGKVAAARNGYLIVRIDGGRSAYFRARDLCKVRVGADGSVERLPAPPILNHRRQPAAARPRPAAPSGLAQNGRSPARPRPTTTAGRQAAGEAEASRRGRRGSRDDDRLRGCRGATTWWTRTTRCPSTSTRTSAR